MSNAEWACTWAGEREREKERKRERRGWGFSDVSSLVRFGWLEPLTKEIRLKIFDPIISNSFPVRYYGISGTYLPDIP